MPDISKLLETTRSMNRRDSYRRPPQTGPTPGETYLPPTQEWGSNQRSALSDPRAYIEAMVNRWRSG